MEIYGPGPKIQEILYNQELPMSLTDKVKETALIIGISAGIGTALGEVVWKLATYNLDKF